MIRLVPSPSGPRRALPGPALAAGRAAGESR
jgi:hypothetical protein